MSAKPNGPAPRDDSAPQPRRTVRIHQQGHLAVSSRTWVDSPGSQPSPRRKTVPERTFATDEEFLEGLRKMKLETGTSLRQIEHRTDGRLPRTTAHNMLKKDRKVLPARPEQVGLLVTACGGSTMDARFWLDQWGRLRAGGNTRRSTRPQSVTDVSAPEEPARPSVIKKKMKRLFTRRLATSLPLVAVYTVLIVALTLLLPGLLFS